MEMKQEDIDLVRKIGTKGPSVFVGEFYKSTFGETYEVVDYFNSYQVIVQFQDEFMAKVVVPADQVRKGKVKNPYRRSVAGVGYLGEGIFNSKSKFYSHWAAMLDRCHNPEYHKSRSTYHDCSSQESWSCLQNFCEWAHKDKYYQNGWHLDKDLCVIGNRLYSEDTCAFVPTELNSTLLKFDGSPGRGTTYVEEKKTYCAKISLFGKHKNLGHFKTRDEAEAVYKKRKLEYFKEIADIYEGQVDPRIINNLRNWSD